MALLKLNPVSVILIIALVYPLFKGFLFKYSSENLKGEVVDLIDNISFIFALIFSIYFVRRIVLQHDSGIYKTIYFSLPDFIIRLFDNKSILVYLAAVLIVVFILYEIISLVLRLILSIMVFPMLDGIEKHLDHRNNMVKRLVGMIFQLPRALCYIMLIAFVLNFIAIFDLFPSANKYIENSKTYDYVCQKVVMPIMDSKLVQQLPGLLNNSFRIVVKESNSDNNSTEKSSQRIIYYNGITLDEGVRSNAQIDSFARNIVKNDETGLEKARTIYMWIGKNISYDNNKAQEVINNDFDVQSGAIPTFNTRKGICFDYSCLYVAMCRAVGLKVRLITGEGFNGMSWINHAWNQVYIKEEGKWINVDTTFSSAGNYFDSSRFIFDHRNGQVAGEW